MTLLQSELNRENKTRRNKSSFAKSIICHCRSKNVSKNRFLWTGNKGISIEYNYEKFPEENTKKNLVLNAWLVWKKPVRDCRGGC